jgi:hypothetical protein
MRRRIFIAGLGSAAAWPLAARAQQPQRMRRVGVLMDSTETQVQSYLAAFVQGLRQLGWIVDQNLRMDVRWNAADARLASSYAAQLVGMMPDVILSSSTVNFPGREIGPRGSPRHRDIQGRTSGARRRGRSVLDPLIRNCGSRRGRRVSPAVSWCGFFNDLARFSCHPGRSFCIRPC